MIRYYRKMDRLAKDKLANNSNFTVYHDYSKLVRATLTVAPADVYYMLCLLAYTTGGVGQ